MVSPPADFVDLTFTLQGDWLPRAYRIELAASLRALLPWIAEEPAFGVHRLNLSAGGDCRRALLSKRTRLTLRLPRARAPAARQLSGERLHIGGCSVLVGDAQQRELLPFHTLFAHLVAVDGVAAGDELAFQGSIEAELAHRSLACRAIFGRYQEFEEGAIRGAPVMLDGLGADIARRVMSEGLGPHRLLGCGVFVPHKSAAAVGAAP